MKMDEAKKNESKVAECRVPNGVGRVQKEALAQSKFREKP